MKHELKTWLGPFAAIIDGRKGYEIRKETDRTFREGDQLYLREWNERTKEYTGRAVETSVTYLTRGPDWDIPSGMVVRSRGPRGEVIEGTYPTANDDPEVTRDLLLLVSIEVPIDTVKEWSPEERKQSDDWASAAMLRASDHDDVVVPSMPHHVEQWVRR